MTPPPMTPPPAYQAAPAYQAPAYQAAPVAATAAKGTSPIVWILVAVGGIFVLGIIGLVGTGMYVAHLARNPGALIGKLITASNPNAEVVNTDTRANTVTIRDKKTGEEVTMSFDDVKNGKFKMSAVDREGKIANVEIGGGAGKTPSWVPVYPGSKAEGNFTAHGNDGNGTGTGGIVTFASSDSPSKVIEYYSGKINSMGMKVLTTTTTDDGGMIMSQSDDEKRSLHVTVAKGSGGGSTIGLTFGEKN